MEYLHAVVARVGDGDQVAVGRPCRGQGIPELAVGAAARAELADERAVGAEQLHAVVARVGDGERAARRRGRQRRRGDGDILCTCAYAEAAYTPIELVIERAVAVHFEHLDAAGARLRHDDLFARREICEGRGAYQ